MPDEAIRFVTMNFRIILVGVNINKILNECSQLFNNCKNLNGFGERVRLRVKVGKFCSMS
jgi:hypothetical protein